MIRLELRPSLRLAALVIVAHAAAAASLILVMPGLAGAALAAALVALGGLAAWSRALLRSPVSVRALELAENALVLELSCGDRFAVEVPARRYVSRWLVILPVRRPLRRAVLVTPDMLGRDSFRRLRLWALWGRLPVASAPPAGAGSALH